MRLRLGLLLVALWPLRAKERQHHSLIFMRLSILVAFACAGSASAGDVSPEVLYKQHCVMCQMSPETIVNALESGLMKQQGAALASSDRRALAEWLTGKTIGSIAPTT